MQYTKDVSAQHRGDPGSVIGVDGKQHCESARNWSAGIKGNHADAVRLLNLREGKVAEGVPVTPKIGRLTFDDAAADLVNDYSTNGKRSIGVVKRRVTKHLTPFFRGRRMGDIHDIGCSRLCRA